MNRLNDEQRNIACGFIERFNAAAIVNAAKRNDENAICPVLTWLRDYFNTPKSLSTHIAEAILRYYEIDNYTLDMPKQVIKRIEKAVFSDTRVCVNSCYRIISNLDIENIVNKFVPDYPERSVRFVINDVMTDNNIASMFASRIKTESDKCVII